MFWDHWISKDDAFRCVNAFQTSVPRDTTDSSGRFLGKTTDTEVIKAFKAKRVHLLSLLDRDGKIASSALICSACSMTYAKSQFLSESNTERACVGTTGRMWLCPHFIRDYDQVQHWQSRCATEIRNTGGFCEDCLGFVIYFPGVFGQTSLPMLDMSDVQTGKSRRSGKCSAACMLQSVIIIN